MTLVKKSGTRHKARKRAVDLLFEAEVKNESPIELIAQRREIALGDDSMGKIHDYTAQIIEGVAGDARQIDSVIESHLREWTLPRLPAVDRAILRLATWELFNTTDVPTAVVVDEAVELAKELSTDDSPGFVNGVLGRIVLLAPQVRASLGQQSPSEDA
ncbi:transcription antitermination factor NusB [Williamsia muralis]|uniref:Transcription antitermination protein NusB n=1 Tax=Williamsia marianensis TaxID=85044 RepID=A0A315SN28_WILMA|nr:MULTISPECIES: transcription antitermination factor NusB [Williamsia]PVY32691.1 NusB antitermination factor [Williamsia marianensis]RKR95623.1 NusB antitermination factor [Williamsia muralis]